MTVERNQLATTLRVIMLRECSKVERCHTVPHHGSYTDGQHSFDMAMLYLTLCPEPTMTGLKAILAHDLGERWTGDMPAPVKWADGEMSKRFQALENQCLSRLGFRLEIGITDMLWLRSLDALELWLWAHDQMAMGNANAAAILGNLQSFFMRNAVPTEVATFLKDYEWTRTPDEIPK